MMHLYTCALLISFVAAPDMSTPAANLALTEPAPVVHVKRDDHVATVEMDFDPYNGIQLWQVGDDGTDAVGYRVQWWPDAGELSNLIAECGCATDRTTGDTIIGTADQPHQLVTSNTVTQIQPIANNTLYHLKVEKLNSFGQICSPATELTFMGGDPSRVDDLRNTMTFFDDFNLPMGPADERNWNTAMTPQTDPRYHMFFINPQCHTHTLTGTLNGAAGDKAQVAQRARKPILIDSVEERRIVFDMDGIFSPRSVWYLDLNPVRTDLTGHMSFFDIDGEQGLPAAALRFRAQGNAFSVHLIDDQGASYEQGSTDLSDSGKRLSTNVRRAFDIRLTSNAVTVFVDSVEVLQVDFAEGAFKPGVYDLLWSTIGYNTSKDDNPYFLSHWDNFGFDGPDIEPYVVHNYVTRIDSTDYQKANKYFGQTPVFNIEVPDDIRPLAAGDTHRVYLVFTYMPDDFSFFSIEPEDSVFVNGVPFQMPPGLNNSNPENPDLIGYTGSILTNRILIGEATFGSPSPLNVGSNAIQFFAANAGIINVHLEVFCPNDAPPPAYTQPAEIHHFPLHGGLPKTGMPAIIVDIDDEQIDEDEDGNLTGPLVSGIVPIEVLAGNRSWADWAPEWLRMPASSAELWSSGGTKGAGRLDFYIRPVSDSTAPGILFASINTSADAPAPQIRYAYAFDSRQWANGMYDIFPQVVSPSGLKSHPAYHGFAFTWDASELAGAYWPVRIEIQNQTFNTYNFTGAVDSLWTNGANWSTGSYPPYYFRGPVTIQADCVIPPGMFLLLGEDAELVVEPNVSLSVLKG